MPGCSWTRSEGERPPERCWLNAKGVALEEYPELGMTIDRGVHRADGFAGIWFKDPDGNILHVHSL